jgi:hypothetical protein
MPAMRARVSTDGWRRTAAAMTTMAPRTAAPGRKRCNRFSPARCQVQQAVAAMAVAFAAGVQHGSGAPPSADAAGLEPQQVVA